MPDPEHGLALTDSKGNALDMPKRYEKHMSKRFRELCADGDEGNKFDLTAEISIIKGMLTGIIKTLEPDEEELRTDSLYLQLISGTKLAPATAQHVIKCVDSFGSTKEVATILRELRETLKQAAEFEKMMPFGKVRAFLAEVSLIVKHEVKDDNVVERIRRRIQALTL